MAGNINRVILTGNLTKDPDVRTLANSGQTVCTLRIACSSVSLDALSSPSVMISTTCLGCFAC